MSDLGNEGERFSPSPKELNNQLREFLEHLPVTLPERDFYYEGEAEVLESEDPEQIKEYYELIADVEGEREESELSRRRNGEYGITFINRLSKLLEHAKVTPHFKQRYIIDAFEDFLGFGIDQNTRTRDNTIKTVFAFADLDNLESGGIFDMERAREIEADYFYRELKATEDRERRWNFRRLNLLEDSDSRYFLSSWAKQYAQNYGIHLDYIQDIQV